MTNFTNLKTWLKRNNIEFTKGYSEYDGEEIHDFVIILSADLQVYDDKTCLTLDYGDNEFSSFESNKELYKEIKREVENFGLEDAEQAQKEFDELEDRLTKRVTETDMKANGYHASLNNLIGLDPETYEVLRYSETKEYLENPSEYHLYYDGEQINWKKVLWHFKKVRKIFKI